MPRGPEKKVAAKKNEAHLKKKKKKCHKCSKARRANEKKERRKIQNKTYYIRRKWNISLALMLSRSSTFS
ncbi:hypothetical protein L917_11237 [Phytophthora nicotianae]|uniref:Uncharacterized protein n=1 Tax=Phytophthora nicotianae TaxID=4792 RepID=W2KZ85_PHYNI|nr:hypothetical protein L917_11237 [Phytophthora nicotianae]